jgi:hypothetical protein
MADKKRYQVLSACVVVPIINTDGAEYLTTVYPPGTFEADPDHPRIAHNVEAGYIAELGGKAAAGVDASGAVMLDNKRVDGEDAGSPVVLNDPGVVNEQQQARSSAASKLPEDGSAPDGRASREVRIEWLARQGHDYGELSKQDDAALKELVKQRTAKS